MKKNLAWLLAITATILIAAGSVFWYIHTTISEYENTFYPNIVIEGENVSGLTKEEGENLLANVIHQYDQINITITAGEQEFYAEKGFNEPIRCKECRANRKINKK